MKFSVWLESSNEEEAFLNHIQANPKDISNWLVFADWLEEQRDYRAELIRTLIQIISKKKTNAVLFGQLDQLWHDSRLKSPRTNQLLSMLSPLTRYAFEWNIYLTDSAEIIRITKTMTNNPNKALNRINDILEGHGVETIMSAEHTNRWGMADYVAMYVNMGDTYDLTVIYDVPRGKFFIADLGTWLERNARRYHID